MTDAEILWNTVVGLSLLGNAVAAYTKFTGKAEKREISPDPLNVREADRYVTEKQLTPLLKPLVERINDHDEEIAQLRDTIVKNYNTIMKSDSGARSRLHCEINDLSSRVANLTGIVEPLKGMAERFAKDVGRLEGILQRHN